GEEYKTDQAYRIARAERQVRLWSIQEARLDRNDLTYGEKILEESSKDVEKKRSSWEEAKERRATAEGSYKRAVEVRTDATNKLALLDGQPTPFQQKLEQVRPTPLSGKALRAIRDFPGLDFMAPSLRVEKTVLDDLWFDLNFANTRKRRVDMCQTC